MICPHLNMKSESMIAQARASDKQNQVSSCVTDSCDRGKMLLTYWRWPAAEVGSQATSECTLIDVPLSFVAEYSSVLASTIYKQVNNDSLVIYCHTGISPTVRVFIMRT